MSGLRGKELELIASGKVNFAQGAASWAWHSPGFSDDAPTVGATGVVLTMAPSNGVGAEALPATQYQVIVQLIELNAAPAAPAVPFYNLVAGSNGMTVIVALRDSTDVTSPALVPDIPFFVQVWRMPAV